MRCPVRPGRDARTGTGAAPARRRPVGRNSSVGGGRPLTALGRRAPGSIEPAVSCLEFAGCRGTLALRLRTGVCEFCILPARFGKLSLEMLDPASQEPLLVSNTRKLPLGSLERAGSRFDVGFGRLDSLGSAQRCGSCRIRLSRSPGQCTI